MFSGVEKGCIGSEWVKVAGALIVIRSSDWKYSLIPSQQMLYSRNVDSRKT